MSLCGSIASARGVSPYLPLNLSPEIERQIVQVLVLGDKPAMRRPIAAATVLEALPKACEVDAVLCENVRNYLRKFMGDRQITQLRVTGAFTDGESEKIVPNAHGMSVTSPWNASGAAYFGLGDYILMNGGVVAYDGDVTPTGTFLSLGFSFAQLDIGWRDHWLSPLNDSSSLISTESPTMPSITLSNYEPISPLGLSYEVFAAQMSNQDGIQYFGSTTSGHPQLTGVQLTMEPASGYALSVNRVMQHGGGARGSGTSQFIDALFKNSNTGDASGGQEFGNQVASITSSIIFPGAVPFAVHIEYAGEDNAWDSKRLGATNMSVGLDFPRLWKRYDVSYEFSEWQQGWYVHHLYPLGLTNENRVIGHWFGDSRVFNKDVFGHSQSLSAGMRLANDSYLRARYRMLVNDPYTTTQYERSQDFSLAYSTYTKGGFLVGAELALGQDVFGDTYSRLAVTMDLAPNRIVRSDTHDPVEEDGEDIVEYFVDAGVNMTHAFERIVATVPADWTEYQTSYHVGVGARRKVSTRNDLGVRLEFDEVADRSLISIRAVDYRFRFNRHIAAGGFFGFSRYQVGLPAYGYYWGAGLQWTNVFKGWDLGWDIRHNDKLTRTKVRRNDPSPDDAGGYYFDTNGTALYISRHF